MNIDKQVSPADAPRCLTASVQDTAGGRRIERTRVPQLAPTVYRPADALPPRAMCTC